MALKTMQNKLDKARANYEKTVKALGSEIAGQIAESLASVLPEGWNLFWCQSDQQYDDENYYFGLSDEHLFSVQQPRKGRLLKAEVPRKTEQRQDPYNRNWHYDEVVEYGSPAIYEWILDEDCPKRKRGDDPDCGDPGRIDLEDYLKETACGVTKTQVGAVRSMLQSISEKMLRCAFGDQADVMIYGDGTYKVQ